MKKTFFSICLYVISCAGVTNAAMSYLDNGVVKIGVDTAKGATITYFSESGSTRNVINSSDPGRMVQQSYYSGPVPFMGGFYDNKDWGWNPVEAGDTNTKVSTVLAHSNDGTTIYTKVIPKQWALNNVDSECTMEKWITLSGNVAHVRCKLVVFRTDSTQQYAALHQELPAVYGTDDLYRIYTYRGTVPFTGGSAELVSSGTQFPWMYLDATEHWMAAVDGTDWGVGVFTPSAQMAVLGFYGTPKMTPPGNPTGTSTSYLAPIRYEVLDHNITYEYDFYLILGNLADIRNFAYAHQPNKKPDYFFTQDRQGWYYKEGVSDTGFPINGHLRVRTPSSDPYMVGPETVWLGSEVPKLYIRARYNTTDTNAKIYWESFSGLGWFEHQTKSFTVIADNQWRTYEVDLSSVSGYSSSRIRKLRFDPVSSGGPGQYVDVAFIASYNPVPTITTFIPDPDTSTYVGTEYVKQLEAAGVAPSTWSLLQGPAGMQIDSDTGYLSGWTPMACDADNAKTIQVQIENAAGSTAKTWQVTPRRYYWADSVANLDDLVVMADEWLLAGANLTADLNCSHTVYLPDFAILAADWLNILPADPVVVTNLSRSNYEFRYGALANGELVYIDRQHAFTNVQALGGSTYIKTRNDDRTSTGNSFLSFDIDQDATVYVAHDTRIAVKPSWLNTFTNTGVNIATSDTTLRLYARDYVAGTVILGGNGGTTSHSMYSVIVAAQ